MMRADMKEIKWRSKSDLIDWYEYWFERELGANIDELDEIYRLFQQQILLQAIPEDEDRWRQCNLRGRIWKFMLEVWTISAKEYERYVVMGPCDVHDKISNDVFRTFKNDPDFKKKVPEFSLVRGLWVLTRKSADDKEYKTISYVQGMNVLLAPFLYVMPELDAFYCFYNLIHEHIPLYVDTNCTGVHRALKLFTECLQCCDTELYAKLKNFPVESFAFSPIMSLLAGQPPLTEVVLLWDFLFAFGPHLNILCVLAQVVNMREEILADKSPANLLRKLPPLDAKAIIKTTIELEELLPEKLHRRLVTHAREDAFPPIDAPDSADTQAQQPQSAQDAPDNEVPNSMESSVPNGRDEEETEAPQPHSSRPLSHFNIDTLSRSEIDTQTHNEDTQPQRANNQWQIGVKCSQYGDTRLQTADTQLQDDDTPSQSGNTQLQGPFTTPSRSNNTQTSDASLPQDAELLEFKFTPEDHERSKYEAEGLSEVAGGF